MKHNQQCKYLLIGIMLFIITGLLLAACGDRSKTIGVINPTSTLDGIVESFKKSMAEFGYTEGENITYFYEGATNSLETLDSVAQRLIDADVDLILSITTPATMAAQRATADTDIPVVFMREFGCRCLIRSRFC